MARGSRRHIGAGSRGKGTGAGGMSDPDSALLSENAVLSNRDKAEHGKIRGRDGKWIETEQLQDHAANRMSEGAEAGSPLRSSESSAPPPARPGKGR